MSSYVQVFIIWFCSKELRALSGCFGPPTPYGPQIKIDFHQLLLSGLLLQYPKHKIMVLI